MRAHSAADLTFCDHILGEVSRTFALSIRCLPNDLQSAVRTAYLLCRIVDTIEDDRAVPPAARLRLFQHFDRALAGAWKGDLAHAFAFEEDAAGFGLGRDSERILCERAETVFRTFADLDHQQRDAIAPRVVEMSAGMCEYASRADARGGARIRDLTDLERYCHYVAGTVGELLTDLFALACPVDPATRAKLDARASRFGIGLQLVNILKDVAEDSGRGDCFLPEACAGDHGVALENLLATSDRPRALALCRDLSRRARGHLAAAEEYTLLWPNVGRGRDARAFCAGPLALALGTIRLVEIGTDTLRFGRAPTVSRDFVAGVFSEIGRAVDAAEQSDSDDRLRTIFDRARVGVAGRPSRPPAPALPISVRRRQHGNQEVDAAIVSADPA